MKVANLALQGGGAHGAFTWGVLHRLLEEHRLGIEGISATSAGAVKLFVCATNVRSGKVRIFTNEEISAASVLASACLPLLHQAVEIDGEFYWDGGYMGNPTLFPLIYECQSRDIIVVHINPTER